MRRLLAVVAAIALMGGACAYESSGTTTTLAFDPDSIPPATSPAALVFEDQLGEGSAVTLVSVTLPAQGFVVLQADDGGKPGTVIGSSGLLVKGTISGVTVPFFLPLEAEAIVHATVYVDADRDGQFGYQDSGSPIDVPATAASGAIASSSALIGLFGALGPAAVTFEAQRTDGASVAVAAVTLPGPGFVAIQSDVAGQPGAVLGVSGILPAGTSAVVVALEPAITSDQQLHAVAYVDRDEDGLVEITGDPPLDAVAQLPDGTPAIASAAITVVLLSPAVLEANDQEGDGASLIVHSATLPAPGFLTVQADEGGIPGGVLGVSALLPAGTTDGVSIDLSPALASDATVWVSVRVDFDGSGTLGDADPVALTGAGAPAQVGVIYTVK
jgi:hypothetical protein